MERIKAADLHKIQKTKKNDVEGPIHKVILAWLRAELPGAAIHHSANEVDMRGAQAQRMISRAKSLGMMSGWPDIEVLWYGNFWTFEVKAPGGYPSENQKTAGQAIKYAGGKWAVVRSVEDVERYITEWRQHALGYTLPVIGEIT